MRTTITLDKMILGVLQRETGSKSKSQAVLLAVNDYLRRRRLKKILDHAGEYHFDPLTAECRHHER